LNFALNQPLSTFALAALDLLDQEFDSYALDVVSVFESTLEDPRQVLATQQRAVRAEAVAAMKADGIDYDELLSEVTYPKPLNELLSAAFAIYRQNHPWLGEDQLSPKSVVRDMWERAMTFTEYVALYGLSRSEGLVLRYLSDAYRALRASVPGAARTEALTDVIEWLGALVRQVDSSWQWPDWAARVSRGVSREVVPRHLCVSNVCVSNRSSRSPLGESTPVRDSAVAARAAGGLRSTRRARQRPCAL
jgi:hypothetical protein